MTVWLKETIILDLPMTITNYESIIVKHIAKRHKYSVFDLLETKALNLLQFPLNDSKV